MKILSFTILKHLILCTIFHFILGGFIHSSSGADQRYEACLPRDCNGVNISFPFYIPNRQDSSCGYPGFEINCNGTYPILYLPESYYVVERISYLNQFVHVYNLASLSSSEILTNCDIVKRLRNTSLPSGELQLEYYGNVTDLYLFSNCTVDSWTSDNFMSHAFACMGFGAAMLEGDESLSVALRDCDKNVVAPVGMLPKVEVSNNTGSDDYAEVLRKGFTLNWRENDCDSCKKSGGSCGFDGGFRCFCPERPHAKTCNDVDLVPTAAASPEVASQTVDAPQSVLDHKEIKGETIFSKPLNKVKMLSDSVTNIEEFKNEVSSISRTSHINIVKLLGFCYEGSKRALVYEFMPNGSLNKCIPKNASSQAEQEIGLEKKLEIAVGIAKGLEYLHTGCIQGILHKDLKPANILLDKERRPKISDFGLAKLFSGSVNTRSVTNRKGTIGYFAPESYSKNVFSSKSDVYSYGLIVLEMVVGKEKNNDPAVDRSIETYFPDWIYRRLEQNTPTCLDGIVTDDKSHIAKRMIIVGLRCIQTDPKNRPTISQVLEMLQGSMESLEIPTYEPYSSSHPTPAANTPTSGSKFHSYSLPGGAANVSTSGSKFHSHSLPPSAANISIEV